MANAAEKVQFNLKNTHYAIYDDTTGTWGAPVAVPGAVSLALEQQGDMQKFYADGLAYFVSQSNQGYAGDLEMAKFPDQMLMDIWGYTLGDTSKVLTENATAQPKTFALLFQVDTDKKAELNVMYACTGTRPAKGGQTNEETITPKTQTSTITAVPMASGAVCCRTTQDTPDSVRENWFKSVFVEGAG